MKTLIFGMALCAAALPALAQNVSIRVGQPGFYGRIDLGDYAPRPVVYAPQPVIVERGPGYAVEPVYLRVPPFQRVHWARFCGRYRACGIPVLFVRDDWYNGAYVPAYREHYGHGGYRGYDRHEGWDRGRVEYRDDGRHEGWDHGRGDGHGHDEGRHEGHGEGHGEGHDHGHGEGHGEGHDHGHGRD